VTADLYDDPGCRRIKGSLRMQKVLRNRPRRLELSKAGRDPAGDRLRPRIELDEQDWPR